MRSVSKVEKIMNKPTPVKSVPDRLAELGELYRQRNAFYKDNYKWFGVILQGMFPQGLTLTTAEEFNRFALFVQVMHKQTRYARSLLDGGHEDSCNDTAVYVQMMAEYDAECKK